MIPRHQHPANPEWAAAQVASLPYRWKKRLFNRWQKTRGGFDPQCLGAEGDATRAAAGWLQDMIARLQTVNLPLDATDADICARAEVLAKHCGELAGVFHEADALRDAMGRVCKANHVEPPAGKKITPTGAIARMCDAHWWRRRLRNLHARAVEGAAISIGYVNKTRDIYVSNESLMRRQQQNRRNAAMLEATTARNENGQEYTLAELAAKGTSNKAIKRGELMTRIAGFERIAVESGHVGLFFTMTCPSRMHKWKTVDGGKVVENKKYDGTNPNEANKHLSKTCARIRAAIARRGFRWYGFRIAEPNHDGTPHWHFLVFFDGRWAGNHVRAALPRVCAIIRRYALAVDGSERGARQHRVDFKPMDAAKGTAAGYIAKYVAKNIDGYGIDKDLFGNDAFTTSQRVEAWAATWRIRQFQQVGGPPVTPWRELRRVKELPADAPEHLVVAHRAVNKVAQMEGATASVAWDRYCQAQGGVFCGRDYRIHIAKEEQDGTGRYGEPLGERPIGVETTGVKRVVDGICAYEKPWQWLVRSVRYVWEIIRKRSNDTHAGIARAWTRVNNCTRQNFADIAGKFKEPEKGIAAYKFEFVGPVNWPDIQEKLNAV